MLKFEILLKIPNRCFILAAGAGQLLPKEDLRQVIEPFDGVFHLVAGRHGVVVLPHDPINGLAGLIEGVEGDDADYHQDDDEAAEGQDQLGLDAHENFSW